MASTYWLSLIYRGKTEQTDDRQTDTRLQDRHDVWNVFFLFVRDVLSVS